MALTVTTLATHVTAPVNFVLMRALLRTANKTLPYFNGTLPGELEKMQGSASVKWRRIDNLATATTALGEVINTATFGLGRSTVTPTITDITVAIAKYGNAIIYNEELDLINVNSKSMQLMEKLGINAGESLNELMRDVFDASTNVRYATSAANDTALTASISLNDIKYSVNQLNRQSALKQFAQGTGSTNIGTSTVRNSYFGVCHNDVEEDVRDLTGFIGVEQYGGYTETFVGEFGAVGGVRWCATEVAPISTGIATTTSTGMRGATDILNDAYSTFIYGKEAVGSIGLGEEHVEDIYMSESRLPTVELINHAPGSSGIGDMYNEAGSLAWKAWFAGKILNTNWLIKVRTLASDLA